MPNLIVTIIIFIVVSILLSILFRWLRKMFKWFIFVWAGVVIFSLIFGYFLLTDINELKERMAVEEKLIIFDLDGEIVTGFYLNDVEDIFGSPDDVFTISQGLSVPDLEEINTQYTQGNLEGILGNSYKVFTLHEEMFDVVDIVNFGNVNITKEEAYTIFKQENPQTIIIDKLADNDRQRAAIADQLGATEDFRNSVLLGLFSEAQNKEGASYLINELKKDNIEIYEETITINVLRWIPSFLLEQTLTAESGGA